MALIKSISGIRGTIGGLAGEGLTPPDIIKFVSAFAEWAINAGQSRTIVIGRDARLSGDMVNHLVTGTLMGMGADVLDTGLSTTPTVEMAVVMINAAGGIIITASHNPAEWNALKLLNHKGEFISDEDGRKILAMAENPNLSFASVNQLGTLTTDDSFIQKHIDCILALPLVDKEAIRRANFKVAIDCVQSTGGIAVPLLLRALGVQTIHELYCTPDGRFPHNPEPLPENLVVLAETVVRTNSDLGIAVDPDVDRVCFVNEDGSMFGEEYSLVAIADYVMRYTKGDTVSNLSSTRALRDATEKSGGRYYAAAVGEVNVVQTMKEKNAVIGGEGNGGIIYPALHYGRDALVGIALFLTHLAKFDQKISELKKSYPIYFMSKNKISLPEGLDLEKLLNKLQVLYQDHPLSTIDGLKIEFGKQWVHMRKSNTEPIIRIYSEAGSQMDADALIIEMKNQIRMISAEL